MQTSLHGSCPVIKGEKWVATKWIRDQKNWSVVRYLCSHHFPSSCSDIRGERWLALKWKRDLIIYITRYHLITVSIHPRVFVTFCAFEQLLANCSEGTSCKLVKWNSWEKMKIPHRTEIITWTNWSGTCILTVSYTHLTLPTIYSV